VQHFKQNLVPLLQKLLLEQSWRTQELILLKGAIWKLLKHGLQVQGCKPIMPRMWLLQKMAN
jgi:hypothetical protein